MNGDTIALLPMKHQAGAPYDLRVRLIEADRVCSPDGFDRLMPCTVQGYEVQSIVQGVETDADGSGRHGDGILDMQPASAGQQQRRGRGGADGDDRARSACRSDALIGAVRRCAAVCWGLRKSPAAGRVSARRTTDQLPPMGI